MQATIESIGIVEETRVRDEVNRLLNEAEAAAGERRAQGRHPLFRPVTIAIQVKGGFCRLVSAFVREISPTGIGLLHIIPLRVGDVIVTIKGDSGDSTRLRSEIKWCQPCGEGWYLSGGRFLGLGTPHET